MKPKRNRNPGKTSENSKNSRQDNPLTLQDYEGKDFLTDAECMEKYTEGIEMSNRRITCADDAMYALLKKCGSSVSSICNDYTEKVVNKMRDDRNEQTDWPKVETAGTHEKCKCGHNSDDSEDEYSSSSDSSSSESSDDENESNSSSSSKNITQGVSEKPTDQANFEVPIRKNVTYYTSLEIHRKRNNPNAVHPDISYNEKGMGNDGVVCKCPFSSRNQGVRHGYYAGEDRFTKCDPETNGKLYHYFLRVNPSPSENQACRTTILVGIEEFSFEGFSVLTHEPLPDRMPQFPITSWSKEYQFTFVQEQIPDSCFTVKECDMLFNTIFYDIFEMLDFEMKPKGMPEDSCPVLHFMPRFVCHKINFETKLLPTKAVMAHFLHKYHNRLIDQNEMVRLLKVSNEEFNKVTHRLKQNIMVNTKKKPAAIRVDHFERDGDQIYIAHHTVRPPSYQNMNAPRIVQIEKTMRKVRYLSRTSQVVLDMGLMFRLQQELEQLRCEQKNQRNTRNCIPIEDYRPSGLFPDVIAHCLMLILAAHHARYHLSIDILENIMEYRFNNRKVIELAMTHPSFTSCYGTNTDHARNLISNCGYRRKYVHEQVKETRKGMHNLMTMMALDKDMAKNANLAPILHNERLEYLGDAVVELIVTQHLFFMLPHHNEGGLATYRTSLVQNRNLASLAKNLTLDNYIQFAHGVELCHEADFRHALANSFEAIMAAIFLDGGFEKCDKIFTKAMYGHDEELRKIWEHINEHELKREDPMGDRELANIVPTLDNLKKLENMMGIEFNNIRLLAKAFTRRNHPINELTRGHNQRLEWLGDTVLQMIISEYLYRNFPFHREGHMSLLRTSLVSNQTQSKICEDLGFVDFVVKASMRSNELRMKDKADLVESFIGALYVDRGMEHCRTFVRMCFLPRLASFMNGEKWNDPKSHLQQLCLSIRDKNHPVPEIPEYRVVGAEGPASTRIYRVAVYFRNKRLAVGEACNVHLAELKAAEMALEDSDLSNVNRATMTAKKKKKRRNY